MKKFLAVVIMLSLMSVVSFGELRQYSLGDDDNFTYNGRADWVYVTDQWLNEIFDLTPKPIGGFDSSFPSLRAFSFSYTLKPGEQINSASLQIGLRAPANLVDGDILYLDSFNNSYSFNDLGWSPSSTSTDFQTFDLFDVLGDDLSSYLSDGVFNVLIYDETGVDCATLSFEVAPEPTTMVLLGLGGLALLKRRK